MEERLQKVIARAGLASRRGAEKLIETGRVAVNGRVVREQGLKVDPALDEIRVDTIPIPRAAAAGETRRTYLLLHKPRGVLCTVRDTHGRRTVLDLVPPHHGKRLFPVGRLDEDSEGLVLLTDDGELTQRLTHPRYGVAKVYDVRLRGRITHEDTRKFESGVWLSEGKTGRSRVHLRKAGPKVSHVHVTLTEGRNREIRRAFAKIGFPVLSLRRIRLGPIVSRGLKRGQYRPLDAREVVALRAAADGDDDVRPPRRATRPRQSGSRRPGSRKPGSRQSGPPRRRPGKPDPAKRGRNRGGKKTSPGAGRGKRAR